MTPVVLPQVFAAFVPGRAAPKGSMRVMPNGRVMQDNARTEEWQAEVTGVCRRIVARTPGRPGRWIHLEGYPIEVPVSVELCFAFLRPAKPRFEWPGTVDTGDLDKLTRCVFDALSVGKPEKPGAGVYRDDALVCQSAQSAVFVTELAQVGVSIQVIPL